MCANNEQDIDSLIYLTRTNRKDIAMSFGLDSLMVSKRGKMVANKGTDLPEDSNEDVHDIYKSLKHNNTGRNSATTK